MRLIRFIPVTTLVLLSLARSAAAQTGVPVRNTEILMWVEYAGILAIGWGVGVTGWLVTGHPAMRYLFVNVPSAWKLRLKNALTSSLPIFKYLLAGGLLLTLGTFLANQLWGIWIQPFDIGLLVGGVVGLGHSFVNIRRRGSKTDFLEANQRYLNESKVDFFTEHDGA